METTRVRLLFEDQDGILSDSQKSEGLERCWVLLKPHQQQTISDLTHHILQAFQLNPPHGILLYVCASAFDFWFFRLYFFWCMIVLSSKNTNFPISYDEKW